MTSQMKPPPKHRGDAIIKWSNMKREPFAGNTVAEVWNKAWKSFNDCACGTYTDINIRLSFLMELGEFGIGVVECPYFGGFTLTADPSKMKRRVKS